MNRFTKLLILILILVSTLACGVKLPTGDKVVSTQLPSEPDTALLSIRDAPTMTPRQFVPAVDDEKGLP